MTTGFLASDLRRDEGLRLRAYPDAATKAEPWTIGYGHTGPEVRPGLVWSEDRAEAALASDIVRACALLDAHAPWWRTLDDARQDVLANMAFNMGWLSPDRAHGLGTFTGALAAIRAHDWAAAAEALLASAWAGRVGERARRLSRQLLTGERALAEEPA